MLPCTTAFLKSGLMFEELKSPTFDNPATYLAPA